MLFNSIEKLIANTKKMPKRNKKIQKYGITIAQYDKAQVEIERLYNYFPDLLPMQIRHFICERGSSVFPSTTPVSLFELLTKKGNAQSDVNRIRDVVQARERVDANGSKLEAQRQHKLLKKKFTDDALEAIRRAKHKK